MVKSVKNSGRVVEIDFLKAVCIVLMVVFHLSYIGDKYAYLKDIVYTFHMPIFLILSGYLRIINRGAKRFFSDILWIFIPYAIIEVAYVVVSSFLPVRDGVDHLSLMVIAEKLFVNPIGPYWYLHTLILCSIAYFCSFNLLKNFTIATRYIVFAMVLYLFGDILSLMALSSGFYFFVGVVVHQSGVGFKGVFKPSWLAIVPLVLLSLNAENLNRLNLGGVAIVLLVVMFLLYCYKYIPEKSLRYINFIGVNTMPILLFSPIFTLLAKLGLKFFAFEPTGLLFAVVATTFAVYGSFAVALCCDKLSISPYIIGRNFFSHHEALK